MDKRVTGETAGTGIIIVTNLATSLDPVKVMSVTLGVPNDLTPQRITIEPKSPFKMVLVRVTGLAHGVLRVSIIRNPLPSTLGRVKLMIWDLAVLDVPKFDEVCHLI